MQAKLERNLQEISTWKRVFFMLIFAMIAGLVRMLIWVIILIQLGTVIFTGGVNKHLLIFGHRLSTYLFHMLLFLTFNTDELAFPFASWDLTNSADLPKPRVE